jgi:hypothetical protein
MQEIISSNLDLIVQAILNAQVKSQWKSEKAYPHLMKRIRLGHLSDNATIQTYEAIIHQVLTNPTANVYVYIYTSIMYPTVTSIIENKLWLVMIGMDSILETAFPPESPNNYLSNKAFIFLGSLEDLVI